MIYAIASAIFFFVLSLAGRLFWATEAAGRALRAQKKSHLEWRISCLAARLLMPSSLAVILLFLIAASFEGPLATERWAVGLGVFVGVIGNHIDREVASGWQPFGSSATIRSAPHSRSMTSSKTICLMAGKPTTVRRFSSTCAAPPC